VVWFCCRERFGKRCRPSVFSALGVLYRDLTLFDRHSNPPIADTIQYGPGGHPSPSPSPYSIRHENKVHKSKIILRWFRSTSKEPIFSPPVQRADHLVCEGDFFLHISSTRKQLWQWTKILMGDCQWREVELNAEYSFADGARLVLILTPKKTRLSAVKPDTYRRHHKA
jgi:hypothetical protein